jgi:hypothetical protein
LDGGFQWRFPENQISRFYATFEKEGGLAAGMIIID